MIQLTAKTAMNKNDDKLNSLTVTVTVIICNAAHRYCFRRDERESIGHRDEQWRTLAKTSKKMETGVSSLYHILLEDRFRIYLPLVTTSSTTEYSSSTTSSIQNQKPLVSCYQELPSIFQKILCFWKNAPSGRSWALEKLTDIFCADIANCPDILSEAALSNFIKGFFDENGKLLVFPDFVMNEVSKMFTAVILSQENISHGLKQSLFNIIRTPLDFGLINKGHMFHIAFQSFQQLLLRDPSCAYDLMHLNEYDASFALTVSLVSCHNYTRKSAKEYFMSLLKFAFGESFTSENDQASHENSAETKAKTEIKQILNDILHTYTGKLVTSVDDGSKPRTTSASYDHSIITNFCEILCSCADISDRWCEEFDVQLKLQHHGLFETILILLKDSVKRDDHYDHQHVIFSIQTLIKLLKAEDDLKFKGENEEKLFLFIIENSCQGDPKSSLHEVIQVSHLLLSQYDHSHKFSRILIELSMLPLISILGVPMSFCKELKSEMVGRFMHKLRAGSIANFRSLIDQTVATIFKADQQVIDVELHPLIDYVTMKTLQSPPIVSQPFLNHNEIRNAESKICILSCLKHVIPILRNTTFEVDSERVTCIGHYVEAVFNSTFKSHEDLQYPFDCFMALLQRKQDANACQDYPDRQIISSVIASLQLHMVSINLTVREEAVKCVREIFLLDDPVVNKELTDAKAVVSVWQCIKDKAETVVFQVLDFISYVAHRGSLSTILSCMNLTQEKLVSELHNIILLSQWDSAKSKAFQILSSVCQTSEIVRYAEILMGLENPSLNVAVLEFMEKLFKGLTIKKDQSIEALCAIVVEGWGDLLLSKANAQDTNAFRFATDILLNLYDYFMDLNVNLIVNKKLHDFSQENCGENVTDKDQMLVKKEKLLSYWVDLGISFRNSSLRHEAVDGRLDNEPPRKVMKVDEDGLSESELFFCTVAKCDKENVLREYSHWLLETKKDLFGDEYFIDSTKELPPLSLITRSFPLQELIFTILASRDVDLSSSSTHLLTFITFKDILVKLNVHNLHQEAHRSTDQYVLSKSMILHDLNALLETSFNQTSRQLERGIAKIFISDILDLIEALRAIEDSNFGKPLTSLDSLIAKLSYFISSETHVLEFIVSKRKTVFMTKWTPESSAFILDSVLDRLHHLQANGTQGMSLKEYFSSDEDLKHLMAMCMEEQDPMPQSQSTSVAENRHEKKSVNTPQNYSEESSVKLMDIDSLQKGLEIMMQENHKHSIFDWLKNVCEFLVHSLKKSTNIGEELINLVSTMNQWYNDEDDEFDHDNDPTLIDCF